MNRRLFLKKTALGTGGFMLAWMMPIPARSAEHAPSDAGSAGSDGDPRGGFRPNAYLEIHENDTVILTCPNPEMGQGVRTMLPMIVADELGADWTRVQIRQADVDTVYRFQFSGGSLATYFNWDPLRQAGAVAREALLAAASTRWGVPAGECRTEAGHVHHQASGRALRFGELASEAAALPLPAAEHVRLRSWSEYRLIGHRVPNVDNPDLVRGAPLFGIDVSLPGMLHATVERAPVPGGRFVSGNLDEVRGKPGVVQVSVLPGTSEYGGPFPGVAIVATTVWFALAARRSLRVVWDETPSLHETSASLRAALGERLAKPGFVVRSKGDVSSAPVGTHRHTRVAAEYDFGFVAHATLEPQNCTAVVHPAEAEVWAPTQQPGNAREKVSAYLGFPPERVRVHVPRIGGGFGRRIFNDYVLDAVAIAREVPGKPVKLLWTREDDFNRSYFRYGGATRYEAALDAEGRIASFTTRQAHLSAKPEDRPPDPGDFDDASLAELLLTQHRWEGVHLRTTIPWGMWRAPGDCTTAWHQLSFLDELAQAANRDPVEFHLDLLGAPRLVGGPEDWARWDLGRLRRVIEGVAAASDWVATRRNRRVRGRGLGLAYFRSHLGYCAQVADVTVSRAGDLRVDRIYVTLDVGPIINLSGAEQQVRGGVLDALSACWLQEATFVDGRLEQQNFDRYPLLRCGQQPDIVIQFLQGTDRPTGLGEPPVPPTPAAVTNAIFSACGKRIRRLPIVRNDLRWE